LNGLLEHILTIITRPTLYFLGWRWWVVM